jgi:hypothetical protein
MGGGVSKLGPVKFAYVVVESTRKHDPSIDVSHAPAAPAIGDVFVFPDDHGRAEYIREDDHGAIVDITHLHFVALGRQTEDGNVDFSFEARRLLALLQIGAQQEQVLHEQIDKVFEKFEEMLSTPMLASDTSSVLERLRREFP